MWMRTILTITAVVGLLCSAGVVRAVDLDALPSNAREALEPAITETTARFNDAEDRFRESPRVETVGPEEAPYMMRASYRLASAEHAVVALETEPQPVVTVRIRADEMEKRATNVGLDDVPTRFAKAPWTKGVRAYLLDFRLRWTGTAWEQLGDPVVRPWLNLGAVQRTAQVLSPGAAGGSR